MKLSFKALLIPICSLAALTAGGCVSSGTYQAKEQESLELKKSLQETKGDYSSLQEKNKKLSEENDALLLKLKKINADLVEIKADNEKLKLENEKLAAAVKPENLLNSFVESFSMLQAENAKLKKALAATETAPKKEAELPVKLNPAVAKPSASVDEGVSPQFNSYPEQPKEGFDAAERQSR